MPENLSNATKYIAQLSVPSSLQLNFPQTDSVIVSS